MSSFLHNKLDFWARFPSEESYNSLSKESYNSLFPFRAGFRVRARRISYELVDNRFHRDSLVSFTSLL